MKDVQENKGSPASGQNASSDFLRWQVTDRQSNDNRLSLRGGAGDRRGRNQQVEEGPFSVQTVYTTLSEFTGRVEDAEKHVTIVGNAELFSTFHHEQGANSFQDKSVCLQVACEQVIRQFDIKMRVKGKEVYPTENDLIHLSHQQLKDKNKEHMDLQDAVSLLNDFGVRASITYDASLSNLATWMQNGRSVILSIRHTEWFEPWREFAITDPEHPQNASNVRHAVVSTAVVYNNSDQSIEGFIVSDNGEPEQGKKFAETALIQRAWLAFRGEAIVSNEPYSNGGKTIHAPIISKS